MKPGDFIKELQPTEVIARRIEGLLRANLKRDPQEWIPEVAQHLAEYLNDPSFRFFGRPINDVYKCILFWEMTHVSPIVVSGEGQ